MVDSFTSQDALLKEWYTTQRVQNAIYTDTVLLDRFPKSDSFKGDLMPLPIKYSNPQSLSASVADAITSEGIAGGNTVNTKWALTVGELNQVVTVSDKTMMASRDDEGAFMRTVTHEIDGALENIRTGLCQYAYGGGGCAIGRRLSASTNVITLTSKYDAINFSVDMVIHASSTDGTSGAIRTGSTYVTDIDADAGTITLNSAAGITSFADNDYLFRFGTHGTSYSPDINGLAAWIPAAAPGATTFYGVDRTADIIKLSGNRLLAADVSGLGIEARLKKACTRVARQGTGRGVTDFFMNPEQWQALSNAMEGRAVLYSDPSKGATGHKAICIMTSSGEVKIWADRFCPITSCWGLRMEDWTLYSMGSLPRFIGEEQGDGLKMLRKSTTNGFEVRINCYPAIACVQPGNQVYVPLASI